MKSFVEQSNQLVELKYKGRLSPGMRNIVLSGNAPFRVLIGFKLRIPIIGYTGFDYYGEAESDENGAVVISTFIGKGPCVFQFFVNTDLSQNPIKAEAGCAEQSMTPDVVYPPHWYQKYLGFYA